ncbi:hypothetical protein [Mycolicibacterium mucogenicum]|uniref:Uncharacterized protein n=1 Tax=Mycolicibacterium mucogenicum DSM 44124 TaxID=1226753 RepID=A0A8H2PF98_MYCMU|nr:hypothetical protein [Mycolicibacterium mucogenicum]KAB7761790.1 hypothetical protein MMUC44124_01160 [Mycolicibacterium mucogenicum DSM 44124]QPG70034.1 hypothetical protein C1S78_003130 [Mycolicibacterium mucogenicum DSM 44124]
MSVTFNRTQLITVANRALREHEKAKADRTKAVAKYRTEHATKDADRTRANAVRLRDGLTKLLRKSGPIHMDDVRDANGGSRYLDADRFYTEPGEYLIKENVTVKSGLLTPAQVIETRSLLQVLGAATGDTISANELKLLGLKNLGPVFAAAAAQSGKQVGA